MATREFILTEHFDAFIEAGVSSGRFRDASEVVREGLRLLEEQEARNRAKLEWLRSAVRKGIDELDRGEALEFASIDDFDAYLERTGDEAASARPHGGNGNVAADTA